MPTITWPASAQVNAVGTGVQDHPAIAIGADGATYLLWDDARSGNAERDPGAGTWGANVIVFTTLGAIRGNRSFDPATTAMFWGVVLMPLALFWVVRRAAALVRKR